MGLNGILTSALTTLQTNSAALRVVSQNVANVNSPNYSRRVVELSTFGSAGQPNGVTIDDIKRASDKFLTQEVSSATSAAAMYDSQSGFFDQINALLGSPGDGNALTSKLSDVFAAIGQAALSPTTPSSQNSVQASLKTLASSISSLSNSLGTVATQIDDQISTGVQTANSLIKQIYDFNNLIKMAKLHGSTDTTYLDERDKAVNQLSQLMDVRTTPQDDGGMLVSTGDGLGLVSDSYTQLSYMPGQNGNYNSIIAQDTNPSTGMAIGSPQALDAHLTTGQIRGLLNMRDGTLSGLRNELGSFAQSVSNAFNREHNASSAYPPPDTMVGRNTGLTGADTLNFTGQTTLALTNPSTGVGQHKIVIDFDAHTITPDGDPSSAVSFTNNVEDFRSNLDSVMKSVTGADPTDTCASFTNGVLTLNGEGRGLVVVDTAGNATSRAGTSFSQFFGLNDVFTASAPSILKTGVQATDGVNLDAAGKINLMIKGPTGNVVRQTSVAIDNTMSMDDAIKAINAAMTGFGSAALNTDGSVTTGFDRNHPGYQLLVTGDTTTRSGTGMSLTEFFGIGDNQMRSQADGFALTPAIANDPTLISSARANVSAATFAGSQVVGAGDNSGLLALQNLATSRESVLKAGNLGAQVTTLNDYAAAFYQDIATKSAAATNDKTTQDDRLSEATSRLTNMTGVSLDEELSNMVIYQQSYSAGARMLTMVGELYDTLLKIQ